MQISLATFGSFLLTCIVIELTPGPNMAYLAIISASHGRRAGWAATIGIALGLLMLGLAAALGLATIVLQSRFLYESLRWFGVGYLLWLAWEGWTETDEASNALATQSADDAQYFRRGLITNLLNPKAALFFMSVLPEFIELSRPILAQTLGLSVIYVIVATSIHATIVALAGTAGSVLKQTDRIRTTRRTLSAGLAIIAVWLAFSTAK